MKELSFFFEDNLSGERIEFQNKTDEIRIERLEDVPKGFETLDRWQSEGKICAGAIAYEAGYAFFPTLQKIKTQNLPLMHFYAFQQMERCLKQETPLSQEGTVFAFQKDTSFAIYKKTQEQIQELIHSGDFYQLNQTLLKTFRSTCSAQELYSLLSEKQKTKYSAFLDFGDYQILSLSPELFFRKEGNKITTEPMKGTAALSDISNNLLKDEKSIAENLMIVDLLRNDLGQIAKPGTVKVEELFAIQKMSTVYQMTSRISAMLEDGIAFGDIFKSLFPCGSITGAPKWRTMQQIQKSEVSPRGYYTGALGFLDKTGNGCFNVAIRTLIHKNGQYSLGVGGGIVADSNVLKEWQEAHLKSDFVRQLNSHFQIFETILYDGHTFKNRDLHLNRLEASAMFFDFTFSKDEILKKMDQFSSQSHHPQKVKVQLNWSGEVQITAKEILPKSSQRIGLSLQKISSQDIFRRHKTTQRSLYDQEWESAQKRGWYDVLFLNEREEIAETSRHNIFLKKKNKWFTPPISSGALPGIARGLALQDLAAQECPLTLQDLKEAEEIMLTNAIQGRVVVEWEAP